RIEIAAPADAPPASAGKNTNAASGAVVLFSQPYEVLGGRTAEIYRELLPPLSSIARRTGHKLIVKLHPFESEKARRKVIDSILRRPVAAQSERNRAHPENDLRLPRGSCNAAASVATGKLRTAGRDYVWTCAGAGALGCGAKIA